MKIFHKLATLATLLIVTITAGAQTTPPAGTPVITLTVANNATIKLSMAAPAKNTPIWVEAAPGTFTPITVDPIFTEKSIDVTGTTLKIYGSIKSFICWSNKEMLTALDVSQNTALTSISCSDNQLAALDVSKNTALTELNCSYNQITTLDVSKNTALTSIHCTDNQLAALNVSKNTALKYLECYNNKIAALDVSMNTKLIRLNCNRNQLTALNISKNTALESIGCGQNQLTTLDVSKNTMLTYLDCSFNQLIALDISKNIPLKTLNCNYNQVTALDVSKNTALTDLGCSFNQLTTLNVATNTALAALHCDRNRLTSLDVSKNTALAALHCSENKLTSLNVSKNTALAALDCCNNPLNAAAIDALYCSLPNRAAVDKATIHLAYGSSDSNHASILISNANNAIIKNWAVKYYRGSNIPTTGNYTCGSILVPSAEVILNKATATIEISKTVAFTATIKPDNATYKDIAWSSSNTAVATVDDKGIVTGVSIGSATITAKAVGGGAEARCTVTVVAPPTPPTGTPEITLTVANNATIKLSMYANANNTPVWIEATPGTYTPITVGSSWTDKNITVSGTTLKVYGAITGFNCSENKEKLTALDVSKNIALKTLNCNYNQITTLDVANNTAMSSLSCYGNLLTTLDVSKNTVLGDLSCSINQLTELDVSKNTKMDILVCNNNRLTKLDVSKNTALFDLRCEGNQLTALDISKNTALRTLHCYQNLLNATAIDALYCSLPYRKAEDKAIIYLAYSSSDDNLASILISNAGNTSIKNWSVNYYNPNTKINTTGNYTCGSTLLPATEVILDKATSTIETSKTVALTATVKPDNATYKAVAWNSSNSAVATVNSNGTVTAIRAGTTTITAKAVDGGAEAKCEVTVVQQPTLITLDKTVATVEAGKTLALTATVKPDNAANKAVTWSSSNTAVAVVNATSMFTGELMGVSAGTATITAKAVDGGFEAKCEVTVTSTTGVETETTSTLCIYPNPATAEVFIKGIERPALVEIYNTMGQRMLTQTLEPSQSINISHLLPGVYTVKVNSIAMKLMVAGR